MDGAKSMAKLVVAVGVVSLGTAIGPIAWLKNADFFGGAANVRPTTAHSTVDTSPAEGSWFEHAKPFCNGVEVTAYLRTNPFPRDWDGSAHGAACLALAGRIEEARRVIDGLEGEGRWRAAGVVFEVGHPAADAGDDVAAGPLMELVVEFWSNHHMALYHAGAARYERGDPVMGRHYLERFLELYSIEDGFTAHAGALLANGG